MYKKWTPEEVNFLIYYWASKDLVFIAKKLNRSHVSIETKASRLKLGSIRKNYVSVNQLVKKTGYGKKHLIRLIKKLGFKITNLPSRESVDKVRKQKKEYRKARKKCSKLKRGREIAFTEEKAAEIIEALKIFLRERDQTGSK
jgi:hypothetical protein